VLAKIAEMPEPDRAMAQRLHALITAWLPIGNHGQGRNGAIWGGDCQPSTAAGYYR
jgi:hypothetical protein